MVKAGEDCVRIQMQLTVADTAVAELRKEVEVKDIRLREMQGQPLDLFLLQGVVSKVINRQLVRRADRRTNR